MGNLRTTQSDIAKKAGVHVATVSMALRDHPRIPAATRERILKIAGELGYTPDPMLSALAIYRDRRRPVTFHGTLGWLSDSSREFDWSKSDHYTRYFEGAKKRAAENGFQLEPFDFRSSSPQRLRSVFRARNITGLLVCPHPTGYEGIDFPWGEFSLMTFGYSIIKPALHAVASAHFRNTRRVMQEIAARGYRRPGLVLGHDKGLTTDGNIPAAYFFEQQMGSPCAKIPPFFTLENEPKAFFPWLKKHRVDVILTINYLVPLLKKTGFSIPGDIGFVNLTLPEKNPAISGIVEDDGKIGSVAADLLVSMIHRGERGIPQEPLRTHLEGSWNEGKTLPILRG
jgi:DNA-binding LacI/PurR family transcriptional regulator